MWPYFIVLLEGHIRQVWLYIKDVGGVTVYIYKFFDEIYIPIKNELTKLM